MVALILAFLVAMPVIVGPCRGYTVPPESDIARGFAPITPWSGHFGVDVARSFGSAVRPIAAGVVTFSGTVVRNRSVTVDHGGGVRSSYSYLAAADVRASEPVTRATRLGTVGIHDGRAAYHLSVRIGGTYVDPAVLRRCVWRIDRALHLGVWGGSYAQRRVRHPRRNLRPTPHRASLAGQRRDRAARHR